MYDSVIFPLVGALATLIVAGRLVSQRSHLRDVAAALGLPAPQGLLAHRLRGEWEGVDVVVVHESVEHLYEQRRWELRVRPSRQAFTVVEVRVPGGLPAGFAAHHEGFTDVIANTLGAQDIEIGDYGLDHSLRFRGRDEAAVCLLLDDPETRAGLRVLASAQPGSEVRADVVRLRGPGWAPESARDLLVQARQLALALAASRDRPWMTFAARHGLRGERLPQGLRLQGDIDGVAITVREADIDGRATGELRVRLASRLPRSLRVLRRSGRESTQGLRLGDPVLDTVLHVHAQDAEEASLLLSRDDVRQELLAAVHGWPEARIVAGALLLPDIGREVAGLERALDDALRLAAALESAAAG